MNGAIVESGCDISNCILGRNVVIQSGVRMINCTIGDDMLISKSSDKPYKDETFTILDHQVNIVRKTSEFRE